MDITKAENEKWIINDLLPEMVHDRCFCESGSREFVEFESATVNPMQDNVITHNGILLSYTYSATVIVRFSGEVNKFSVIIKLMSPSLDNKIFQYFQNEEIFFSKMLKKYDPIEFSKCYTSNLGKYGRPVIALENLLENGFIKVQKLNEQDIMFVLRKIARFHGTGLKLKEKEPAIFKEYHVQFFNEELYDIIPKEYFNNLIFRSLESLSCQELAQEIKIQLGSDPAETLENLTNKSNDVFYTICHGNFITQNLFVKYKEGNLIDAKIINFVFMKFGSIGIDLGTILLQNVQNLFLPTINLDKFLSVYLESLNIDIPDVTLENIRHEFNMWLPYAHAILTINEYFENLSLTKIKKH